MTTPNDSPPIQSGPRLMYGEVKAWWMHYNEPATGLVVISPTADSPPFGLFVRVAVVPVSGDEVVVVLRRDDVVRFVQMEHRSGDYERFSVAMRAALSHEVK